MRLWGASVDTLSLTEEGLLKAKAAADKAVKLGGSLEEAHVALSGVMYQLDRHWRGAEREFKRAIALNPGVCDGLSTLFDVFEQDGAA
jgi:Tfp pilus assembly protein PilF